VGRLPPWPPHSSRQRSTAHGRWPRRRSGSPLGWPAMPRRSRHRTAACPSALLLETAGLVRARGSTAVGSAAHPREGRRRGAAARNARNLRHSAGIPANSGTSAWTPVRSGSMSRAASTRGSPATAGLPRSGARGTRTPDLLGAIGLLWCGTRVRSSDFAGSLSTSGPATRERSRWISADACRCRHSWLGVPEIESWAARVNVGCCA